MDPPRTSEWPPMYLVIELTVMSAPIVVGLQRIGVAKVLSTTKIALEPLYLIAFDIAAISKTLRVGLVGVSSQTSFVCGVSIFLNLLMSEKSEKSTLMPVFGPRIILRYLYVPPYTSSTHMIWSPC